MQFINSSLDALVQNLSGNDFKYLSQEVIDNWNMLQEKTKGDNHDLYLKTDVLLLVEVFEKFINTCSEYCGLDLVIILVFLDQVGMQCLR